MFCPNCGKNLPDNAAFCDGCGSPLGVTPTPAATPSSSVSYAANPIVDDSINGLKGVFSKDPSECLEKAAKSYGPEWFILFGITAFFNMLFTAIKPLHSESPYTTFEPLGLLGGLLESCVFFFVLSAVILLFFKLAHNTDVAMPSILNVTALAMLPMGISYFANTIFGFIGWDGLTNTVSSMALFAFILLLYVGIQKLTEIKVSVWAIVIVLAIVLLVAAGWDELWWEIMPYDYGVSW